MRKILALIAFALCFAAILSSQVRISMEQLTRSTKFRHSTWFLLNGSVAVHRSDSNTLTIMDCDHYGSRFSNEDVSSTKPCSDVCLLNWPNSLTWNAINSPIVQGRLVCVGVDSSNTLWIMNSKGDLSRFNGVEWSTYLQDNKEQVVRRGTDFHEQENFSIQSAVFLGSRIRFLSQSGLYDLNLDTKELVQRMKFSTKHNGNSLLTQSGKLWYGLWYCDVLIDVDSNKAHVHIQTDREACHKSLDLGIFTQDCLYNQCQLDTTLCSDDDPSLTFQNCRYWRHHGRPPMQIDTTGLQVQSPKTTESAPMGFCGTCCLYKRRMDYNDLASDRNGTVYLATSGGLFVFPNPFKHETDLAFCPINITAFPNPANGCVTVSIDQLTDNSELYVVNSNGQIVHQTTINSNNIQLDVSPFATGAYSIVVLGHKSRGSKQLVIVR